MGDSALLPRLVFCYPNHDTLILTKYLKGDMMKNPSTLSNLDQRQQYLRPLWLSIAFSVFAEFLLFLIFGIFLYPAGNLLNKFLWTVVFCGVGMGSVVGAMLNLFVVDRLEGMKAVLATTALSAIILGIACDLLCLSLDQHFQYFGGTENAGLFLGGGMLMAALGGAILGSLLFTSKGQRLLTRLGF